ncbi:MAG: hypothetical protein ACRDO0_17170 [Nocardioidaceae bacterium]
MTTSQTEPGGLLTIPPIVCSLAIGLLGVYTLLDVFGMTLA